MLTNTILHPLDTVKTVRQADPKNFIGIGPTILAIVRKRGPTALYAGIAPALLGSALSSALYFGFYEFAKHQISQASPGAFRNPNTRMPLTAVSAACGNVASSILFVPKEVVKQRMQSGVDSGRFLGAAAGLIRTAGISGLYRGYKATLLRNIPSTMIKFATYEELKLILARMKGSDKPQTLSTAEVITAASLSGVISSAITTPMDVLKTRFATGQLKPGTPILPAVKQIVQQDGIAGLYVGFRPRTLWAALFAAIGFTTYEMCKKWALGTSPLERISRSTKLQALAPCKHSEYCVANKVKSGSTYSILVRKNESTKR